MKRAILLAGILAAAPAAVAGPYDGPYVLFEPARRSAVRDTVPGTIMRIDGKATSAARREPVPPGRHRLEVSVPGPLSGSERKTLEVDAAPCTRYFLAARRTASSSRHWEAFDESSEPIGECAAKAK